MALYVHSGLDRFGFKVHSAFTCAALIVGYHFAIPPCPTTASVAGRAVS